MNNENFSVFNAAIKELTKNLLSAVDKMIKKAPYTWEFKTKILADNGDNTYKIKYCGIEYKAISAYKFDVGTMVRVIVPNNNFSDKYIVPYRRCKGFIGE